MKTFFRYLYLTSICLPLVLSACAPSSHHYIYGDIAKMPDGMVYLSRYDGGLHRVDSIGSVGGSFKFVQPQSLPDIMYLHFESIPDFTLPVVVEGLDLYVSGEFNYHHDIKTSGTHSNEIFEEYRRSYRKYELMHRAVEIGVTEYGDSTLIMDTLRYELLIAKRDSITWCMGVAKDMFVFENPSSIISAMLLASTLSDHTTKKQVDSLINRIDPQMSDNVFLQRLRQRGEGLN